MLLFMFSKVDNEFLEVHQAYQFSVFHGLLQVWVPVSCAGYLPVNSMAP